MSGFGPRNMGHGPDVALVRFVNGITAPPTSPDPVFYRVGDQLFLRDADGIVFPVAVGADGVGVKAITLAQSPYQILPTDRVLLVDTTDGAVTARLPAAGGPFLGRWLTVIDAKRKFGTNAFTLDGNTKNIGAASTLVLNTDDASSTVYWADPTWEVSAGAGSVAALALQLGSPGEIGGTTPARVNSTLLSLPAAAEPAVTAGRVQLYNANNAGLAQQNSSGALLLDQNITSTATGSIIRRLWAVSLVDDAQQGIAIAGGGHATVTAVGATGSASGSFSFAANGTTNANGITFAEFAVTDTDTKLCAFASAGAVVIKNRLGATYNILVDMTELVAA